MFFSSPVDRILEIKGLVWQLYADFGASPEIPNIPAPPAVPKIPDSPHIPHSHDPSAVPESQGIIINLNNGELCLFSVQCKSSCCHRSSGIDLFRCAPRGAERDMLQKATQGKGLVAASLIRKHKMFYSTQTLYGTYYYCPCEKGLDCKGDWSIGGFITSTNFGTCVDPN
ncbi:hypothetical protein SRHO_G00319790 [Serrasalmus rhombeus]